MKAYKILIVIFMALILCLGITACKGNADPLILHSTVGIDEDTLRTKVIELLELPEETVVEINGEYNLNAPGKYSITCQWDKKEKSEVKLWLYANSMNVTIDGKPFDGEKVHLNYNKAVASKNFTTCIVITDYFGNEMDVTKDSKCMDFENKEGSYLVYYNATDAAGQTFSVRVVYDVTYEHYIEVENGAAFVFENSASFEADFDGATNVWLEDENGKIDTAFYEIQENSILLKKEYYGSLLGKKVAIKVCSANGNTHFYMTVYDEASYKEYEQQRIKSLFSCQTAYASFDLVKEAPDGVTFEYAYRYVKKSSDSINLSSLVWNTKSEYGAVSFDLYVHDVKTKEGAAYHEVELQVFNGVTFVSVVDSEGNDIPVAYKSNKPSVTLTKGKTYRVALDMTESLSPEIGFCWGGRLCELYLYNFEFKPTYTYIVDNLTQSIVCKKSGEILGYFAWPTVTKLDGDRLIAVASGFRKAHIDTESKVAVWYSEDGGKTWSEPQVLVDTLLDDRDSGVVYWNGKIIVSWFCASKQYYINNNASKYGDWANTIDDDYDTKYMGGNYIIGEFDENGDIQWSDIYTMPEGMFTPHGLIINPEGGLTSVGYLKYDKVNKRWGTGIAVRTTTGEMDENGFIWSDAIVIADSDTQYAWDFQEPYGIYNDDGVLIVVMRADKGLYQCELYPGETKFTDWRKIAFVQETPAHMIEHSSGVMVMTYGYRGIYVDPVTGKTVSYTERNKDTTLGIRARLSYDGGLTWTREVILTSGLYPASNSSDWGYTSSVELSDGKILTLFYQRTGSETMASIYQIVWELPEKIEGEVTLTLANGMNSLEDDGAFITTVGGQVGEKIEISTPIKDGYTFAGWYLDYACSIPFTGTTYSQNLILYAKWGK